MIVSACFSSQQGGQLDAGGAADVGPRHVDLGRSQTAVLVEQLVYRQRSRVAPGQGRRGGRSPGRGDGSEHIPTDLAGQHELNPVNRVRQQGVQIELPPRVRGASPLWWDWEGPHLTPHTQSLIDGLAQAVHSWNPVRVATELAD